MENDHGSDVAGGRFYFIVLMAVVLLFGYLSYRILMPFLAPMAWAMVFAILFYPLYNFVLGYVRWRSAAAAIVLGIILLIIIGPISYLSFLLAKELRALVSEAEGGKLDVIKSLFHHPWIGTVIARVVSLSDVAPGEWDKLVAAQVSQLGRELAGRITSGVGSILTVAIDFILTGLTTFFLLRDGTRLPEKILGYLPFSEGQEKRLVQQIRDVVISTMYGGVVIALIQGATGGIAFFVLGFASPVIWGFAIAVAAFLPVIGPSVIWAPTAAYLAFQGAVWQGIALVLVGLGIGMIDFFLRPILVGQRTKIPFLVLFFSVIGGIKLFGLIGFVMGPLVLALFVLVLEVCRSLEEGGSGRIRRNDAGQEVVIP